MSGRDREPVAFVLGTGGNLGAVQIGMLRALLEHDIRPGLIVGSSTGAINGASFADEPSSSGIDRLERVWRLEPFHCVATKLVDAAETWFDRGPLIEAVLASASMPVVHPPVDVGGERFLDGGILNDVPLSRAVERGASTVYILGVGRLLQPWTELKRPFDIATRTYWIARKHRFRRDLDAVPEGETVHLLLDGDPQPTRFHDLTQTSPMIEGAYRASSTYLDEIVGTAAPRHRSGAHRAT
jgi:NTE family protein